MDEATQASTAKPESLAPRTSAALKAVDDARRACGKDSPTRYHDALIYECVLLEMDLQDAVRVLSEGLDYVITNTITKPYKTRVRELLERLSKRGTV